MTTWLNTTQFTCISWLVSCLHYFLLQQLLSLPCQLALVQAFIFHKTFLCFFLFFFFFLECLLLLKFQSNLSISANMNASAFWRSWIEVGKKQRSLIFLRTLVRYILAALSLLCAGFLVSVAACMLQRGKPWKLTRSLQWTSIVHNLYGTLYSFTDWPGYEISSALAGKIGVSLGRTFWACPGRVRPHHHENSKKRWRWLQEVAAGQMHHEHNEMLKILPTLLFCGFSLISTTGGTTSG